MTCLSSSSVAHSMKHFIRNCSTICDKSISGIKALWVSDIILGKIDFTQFASTFDTIRDTTLPKLMGRNYVIFCGSFFLGMTTICVKFIFLKYLPECKADNTAMVTSSPTMCQNFWKKKGDIPSSPGDFDGCMLKRALLTSSSKYGWFKEPTISSVTTLSTSSSTLSIFV